MMAETPVLSRDVAGSLLRPSSNAAIDTEERRHPWTANHFDFDEPFLRIWDCHSGSQPDKENNCMMSRAPQLRLDTFESRKTSMTTHFYYQDWTPTPYISFTSSPAEAHRIASCRSERRGTQTLTVVDPNTRIADGLPIVKAVAEMDYYDIQDPYAKRGQYYVNEYLCLWEVPGREIVGHWEWNNLVASEKWYEEIILPAFREHRTNMMFKAEQVESAGLTDIMNELSLTSNPSESEDRSYRDLDASSEESAYDFQDDPYWSDTDDEVEEANAADDIIKIIEGNW